MTVGWDEIEKNIKKGLTDPHGRWRVWVKTDGVWHHYEHYKKMTFVDGTQSDDPIDIFSVLEKSEAIELLSVSFTE